MSVEFRQRSAGDFVAMLNRRKWQVILPTITCFLATLWVVAHMPHMYESSTTMIIMPPTISEKVAPSLTDADLSKRIQAMRAQIYSRSSVEEMIKKFDLYAEERAAGVPIEQLMGRLIISVETKEEKSDDKKLLSFTVTFRDPNPEAAQGVVAMIADRYKSMQNVESTQSAETTRELIDQQMAQAKSTVDALEKQRLAIMMQNVETLPESGQGLIAQLSGLRQREETISKEKEGLMNERGRVQESVRALNSQMRLIENFGEKETQDAAEQASRVEDTPAYGSLIQRRAELSSRLASLKKQYREKHPDIVQAQTDLEKINEELDRLSKSTDQRVKQASQTSQRKAELQKKSMEIERDKAESQIAQIDRQMQARDAEVAQNSVQIAALEAKINTIPNVKVALEGVDNQYQSAKSNYDELLKKYNNAQQQVARESNAQGETIRVVDPASYPQQVKSTKRLMLIPIASAVGAILGLFLAAFFEVPRMLKIQSIEDAGFYTGLPVLASVPALLTEREIAAQSRTHKLKVLTGAAAALAAVPLVVMVLEVSRILPR